MDGKKKLTKEEFMPYLPATFNVPVKEVYAILGMSRHSLAPMRAKWGARWPYADVCRGQFGPMTWKEIDEFRTSAIENAQTDSRIVTILKIMEKQSAKHIKKLHVKGGGKTTTPSSTPNKATPAAAPTTSTTTPSSTPNKATPAAAPTTKTTTQAEEQQQGHVTMGLMDLEAPDGLFPDDEAYWTGLSELLLIHLDAPPGELFPPLEL